VTESVSADAALALAETIVFDSSATSNLPGWDLPATRNPRVDFWIDLMKGRQSKVTKLWLERSGKYAPMIRQQLRARGMPEDLVYLAFIESGFSPDAHSRASAVGLWQFIAETGRRYGLESSPYLDERRDPIEATSAALDYLQELHKRFGSWYLAAAAYNTGENRVDRILRERVGGLRGDEELFWRIAPYLPEETRDYVPLMLAAGFIGKNPAEYGFTDVNYQAPLAFDTVPVDSQTSLELIAIAANVPLSEVKSLNPHLVRGTTPPGRAWHVRIPVGSDSVFATNYVTVAKLEQQREKARLAGAKPYLRTHRVRSGETLSGIARKYGVSVNALVKANAGLSSRSKLRAGKTITIPGGAPKKSVVTAKRPATKTAPAKSSAAKSTATKSTATKSTATKSTATKSTATKSTTSSETKAAPKTVSAAKTVSTTQKVHTVRDGETLANIAYRYGLTVSRLQSLNGLKRGSIYPGQKLRVS
jgi:membrane-bound lytic murein transglycosylase D